MAKKQTKQTQNVKRVKPRNQSITCPDCCCNKANWADLFRDYFRPRCK